MYPYPTYTMPDGNKAFNRPKDGEKFTTKDGQVWMWDDMFEKWTRYNSTKWVDDHHPDFEQDMELARKVSAKCECGSEKVNSNFHSSWCPKYKP